MNKEEFLEKGNSIQRKIYLAIEIIVPIVIIGVVFYYVVSQGLYETDQQTFFIILAAAAFIVIGYIVQAVLRNRRKSINISAEDILGMFQSRGKKKQFTQPSKTRSIEEIREKYRK